MSPTVSDEMDSMADVGESMSTKLVIASDPAESRRVQEEIEKALRGYEFSDREIFSIKLALEEALVNAIKHGNQLDRAKKVCITYEVAADRFEISITDEGKGFDPEDVPDPTAVENLERPSGRGLMLMRHYMTEVHYNGCGNSVSMKKLRSIQ
jgi:serine/threonine-protein kinase RsbW